MEGHLMVTFHVASLPSAPGDIGRGSYGKRDVGLPYPRRRLWYAFHVMVPLALSFLENRSRLPLGGFPRRQGRSHAVVCSLM